jgi:hypothetical protein
MKYLHRLTKSLALTSIMICLSSCGGISTGCTWTKPILLTQKDEKMLEDIDAREIDKYNKNVTKNCPEE